MCVYHLYIMGVIMANLLVCDIVVSKFELSCPYVHCQTKGMNSLIPTAMD